MRSYYRLLILNLAVMVPFTAAMLLQIFRKPALLVIQLALLVANYVITRKVARQGEASSLEKSKWGFGLWWAWTSGPSITGWLPLMLAFLIMKTDFQGIIDLTLMAYFAFSSWATVNKSEQRRDDIIASKQATT
jgi:hypothetical protein